MHTLNDITIMKTTLAERRTSWLCLACVALHKLISRVDNGEESVVLVEEVRHST